MHRDTDCHPRISAAISSGRNRAPVIPSLLKRASAHAAVTGLVQVTQSVGEGGGRAEQERKASHQRRRRPAAGASSAVCMASMMRVTSSRVGWLMCNSMSPTLRLARRFSFRRRNATTV